MARGYRRLGRATDEAAEPASREKPAPTPALARLVAALLAYEAGRNPSAYAIRNHRSAFASLRRFCLAEGLSPAAWAPTTDFFRRSQAWLLAEPRDAPRRGRPSGAAARWRPGCGSSGRSAPG